MASHSTSRTFSPETFVSSVSETVRKMWCQRWHVYRNNSTGQEQPQSHQWGLVASVSILACTVVEEGCRLVWKDCWIRMGWVGDEQGAVITDNPGPSSLVLAQREVGLTHESCGSRGLSRQPLWALRSFWPCGSASQTQSSSVTRAVWTLLLCSAQECGAFTAHWPELMTWPAWPQEGLAVWENWWKGLGPSHLGRII